MEPALVAAGLRHLYHTAQGPLPALDGVDLAVGQGEFVAIVGPSGCGKSTLLRILGGLLTPTAGQVCLPVLTVRSGPVLTVRSGPVPTVRSGPVLAVRPGGGQVLSSPRRQVGYVFQKVNLMPWRTVLRNITLPLEVAGVPRSSAEQRGRELIALVGLAGFEGAYPRVLSGGMAQRVAIARALVADPAVLLLDEPFGSLDALSREQMNVELLRIWQARQVTAVMVTHDLHEAVFLADRVLVMSPRPGRIRAEVKVDLPRPRGLEVTYTEFFGALARRVREAIGWPMDGG